MTSVVDAYAAYYSLLYEGKDYGAEARYVSGLLKSHARGASSVLELGCGTGAHAEALAREGFRVHGVDVSPGMLKQAQGRKEGLPSGLASRLAFEIGDARTFRRPQQFDAVISLFHVFSYQTTNADLLAAFETAAVHLRPGGVLIFDYWYGPAVLTQKPSVRERHLENAEVLVTRLAEPRMFWDENCVEVNYTVTVQKRGLDHHDEIRESHKMRYLFLPEVEAMSQPWFLVRGHHAWMTMDAPGINDWAAITILEKRA